MSKIRSLRNKVLNRRLLVFVHDLVMVSLAWLLSFLIYFDFSPPPRVWVDIYTTLPIVLVIQGSVQWAIGLYRGLWRFASVPDLWNIICSALYGLLSISIILFMFNRLDGVPRPSIALYPIFLVMLLSAPRFARRVIKDRSLKISSDAGVERVIIFGAGSGGEMLAREMRGKPEYRVIGFLDDDPRLHRAVLQGLPVMGNLDDFSAIAEKEGIDLAVIAIPSANSQQMRRAMDICQTAEVPVRSLPKLLDLDSGDAAIHELRKISIEDLLGREPVSLDWLKIEKFLSKKTVMVTGGGGSIGSELSRQVARMGAQRLIIFERNEFNLYKIEMEICAAFPHIPLTKVLGDICDSVAVDQAFTQFKPDIVFHAAAYKHVPMLEQQIRAAVKNNILGTRMVAEASARHSCSTFVMISTDKAVNPANVMGKTKRIAEIFCQNMDALSDTKFLTVRFGNVMGSAGSVVPLFSEQIEAGGPVTVTHPETTRYFMTIREACLLILQSAVMGAGGEIFVLEMGEPVRILDLAEQMIRLSGKTPGLDIPIEIVGLRSGEKLHEELFYEMENLRKTNQGKVLLAPHSEVDWPPLIAALDQISRSCNEFDTASLEQWLENLLADTGIHKKSTPPVRPGLF